MYELTHPDVASVWEVSTSDEHPSLEAFKADVLNNPLVVNLGGVTYLSTATGTTLALDTTGAARHQVNADPVDWSQFRHGFRTPFSENPHGSRAAQLDRGGYAVNWDWDPDEDGVVDEPPSKTVDNLAGP
ncbi:MAG: hypothetical protein K0R11_2346 [Acidimicrobiales bacterium]|nr:hypothetical protein [Acidimicrobiales bacterium]